jgi:carboxymethylenebutenolidase
MIVALLRRLSARSSRTFAFALLAASLCAQDKEAAPLPWNDAVPPCSPEHVTRALEESTRHGEWVDIALADGSKMESWVVYPERKDKAPVVLVIHDIRGMSDWARALGDQLAQDGFIAIVPDFLSGKGKDGGGTKSFGNDVGQAIRKLTDEDVCARLDAAKTHGESLPSSNGKTAVVGFCWGGSRSFGYAIAQKKLGAAVVFYGDVPGATKDSVPQDAIARIEAPVLGLYGGNDARINATLPPTIAAMMEHKKTYEFHAFEGAGHAFMSRQPGANTPNHTAAAAAWPLTVAFLRRHVD